MFVELGCISKNLYCTRNLHFLKALAVIFFKRTVSIELDTVIVK